MCSGRVDLEFVLRAFANGMDGVFIGGCRLGECNYTTHGNYHALNMVLLAKKILEHIGLNPERLRVDFMSSGEGMLFTELVDEFTGQVSELGPLGSGDEVGGEELKARIAEVTKLVPYIKVRQKDKLAQRPPEGDYGEFYTLEEIDHLFDEVASYYIDPEKCQACGICARRCPVQAISGGKNLVHVIDQGLCIKCGTCFAACPPRFGAIQEIVGEPAPPPPPEDQRAIQKKPKQASA